MRILRDCAAAICAGDQFFLYTEDAVGSVAWCYPISVNVSDPNYAITAPWQNRNEQLEFVEYATEPTLGVTPVRITSTRHTHTPDPPTRHVHAWQVHDRLDTWRLGPQRLPRVPLLRPQLPHPGADHERHARHVLSAAADPGAPSTATLDIAVDALAPTSVTRR